MSTIEISHKSYSKFNMNKLESHHYYELYFLFKGDRKVFINEKSFNAKPYTVFFISPYTLHKTMGDEYSERINVYVSKEFLNESNVKFLNEVANNHYVLSQENAEFLYKVLLNASNNQSNDKENIIATTNAILFYLKSQELKLGKEPTNATLQKILKYVNNNFDSNVTIKDICEKFYISKSSLFRIFNSNLQCSVLEYVLTLRLNHAKNLLTSTNLRIEEIAKTCGFNSANYFSLIFKRKVKLSPLKYRAQNKR